MSTRRAVCGAAMFVAVAASAGDVGTIRAPGRLSETGLYATTGTGSIDPRNLPYAPQYPLWSDGAVKTRWIRLPEGAAIDVSNPDAWVFPVGTKLWKEFAFSGRKIETRMLWRASADAWVYATYAWNVEQTEAVLAPEEGMRNHVEIASAKRHSIPGVSDCKSCHESAPSQVLGFNALQLSDDRDPMAVHAEPLRPGMVTLRLLAENHRLDPPRPEFVTSPPRIRAASPRERAVLGYFAGNCGHCHNTSGPLARIGLVLAPDASPPAAQGPEPAIPTAVNAKGRFQVPGVQDGATRLVAPGAPERSAIVYRMRSRRPTSQMPPLGTELADADAIRLVESWIADDLAPASASGPVPASPPAEAAPAPCTTGPSGRASPAPGLLRTPAS